VKSGIFTNVSDAGRGALRRGIQAIKEERGM
jgi:Arc/MetJ-type ribon-helix-helix transcriptional regulator